ncbi:MAG TPA: hypothetical protein VN932_10070 [Rhizomicrobium sp.]|nr:hypothetical protein [Rhizomicrobium sp.]
MSHWKAEIARRPVLATLLGLFGLSLVGGTAYEAAHIIGRRYAPTAFDDLLSQLPDRDAAEKLGAVVLSNSPAFDVRKVARDLRAQIGTRTLSDVLGADAAQGRLAEVNGWLMPQTLVQLCGLAAS